MKAASFPGVNLVLNPPTGQEADVVPLPCYRDPDNKFILCQWEISAEEIAVLISTRRICLQFQGPNVVPHCVFVLPDEPART